jgi:ABC-type multidrug transport system permease subunit
MGLVRTADGGAILLIFFSLCGVDLFASCVCTLFFIFYYLGPHLPESD